MLKSALAWLSVILSIAYSEAADLEKFSKGVDWLREDLIVGDIPDITNPSQYVAGLNRIFPESVILSPQNPKDAQGAFFYLPTVSKYHLPKADSWKLDLFIDVVRYMLFTEEMRAQLHPFDRNVPDERKWSLVEGVVGQLLKTFSAASQIQSALTSSVFMVRSDCDELSSLVHGLRPLFIQDALRPFLDKVCRKIAVSETFFWSEDGVNFVVAPLRWMGGYSSGGSSSSQYTLRLNNEFFGVNLSETEKYTPSHTISVSVTKDPLVTPDRFVFEEKDPVSLYVTAKPPLSSNMAFPEMVERKALHSVLYQPESCDILAFTLTLGRLFHYGDGYSSYEIFAGAPGQMLPVFKGSTGSFCMCGMPSGVHTLDGGKVLFVDHHKDIFILCMGSLWSELAHASVDALPRLLEQYPNGCRSFQMYRHGSKVMPPQGIQLAELGIDNLKL